MKKYLLGYPVGSDVEQSNLMEYPNVKTADYETDEYCWVEANSLEEAKDKFEETFEKLKIENKISGCL